MDIPDFQTIMLPLLRHCSDGGEHTANEVIEALATTFQLSEDERAKLLSSGRDIVFNNRVRWAITYLRHAGLLETTRRAYFRQTARGRDTLAEGIARIDIRYLQRFPEFADWRNRSSSEEPLSATDTGSTHSLASTPEETLEAAFQTIRRTLADDLLTRVKTCSPAFFERLVVELLVQMGYGGSRQDAGEAIGRSGDEGIDGTIKEDVLGLDVIYIQAKRWSDTVGRPEIQRFAGALQGRRARKGIFLTTSAFTQEAKDFVAHIDSKIVLIDGRQLADLMFDHNIGVSVISIFPVKRVDSDYFAED